MATMIYFDTLQYVKTLEAAGFSDQQAEAFAKAQQEAFSECLDTMLATKTDISKLESAMQKLELVLESVRSEMKLSRWMLGVIFAGVSLQIFEKFFS